MNRIIERFPTVPIFQGLEALQIAQLLNHAEDIETIQDQVIVEQGRPGNGLYIISAGIFEVVRETEEKSRSLAQLEELTSFGEMSLFDDTVCSASVICRKPGRLKNFSKEAFHSLLDSGDLVAHKVTLNIAKLMSRRLARVDDQIVS